jgi:AraC-like DNA-binding protein
VTRDDKVWDPPRAPASLLGILHVARERGLPPGICLAGTGLDPAELSSPETVVLTSQEMTAIRNLVRFSGDEPGLGSRAGARFTLAALGVYGMAMMSSRTVRDAVAVGLRHGFGKYSWGLLPARLEPDGRDLLSVKDEQAVRPDIRNFVIERDLVFIASVLDKQFGEPRAISVETTLPADRVRGLRAALGSRLIRTGAPRNTVRYPASTLGLSSPYADSYAAALCDQQCQLLLERVRTAPVSAGTRGKVRSILLRLPPESWSLDRVASAYYVHPRTLNRLLLAEDCSFREIVESVRDQMATDLLLGGTLSVTQVAQRVGYTTTSSFARAYRRRTGVSPGEARRSGRALGESRPLVPHST